MFASPKLLSVLLVAGTVLTAAAQTRDEGKVFMDPDGRFSIEFPKDWRSTMVSGSGESMATFVHPRNEAAVLVEVLRPQKPLAPEDITQAFAEVEADRIKETQPGATDVVATLTSWAGGPAIVIDYVRAGQGDRQRVRQYSYPVGEDLYRVTCMALQSTFDRNEPALAAMAGSLKPAGASWPEPR